MAIAAGALFCVLSHPQAHARCVVGPIAATNISSLETPPVISGRINNTPVSLIIDTGSDTTIITTDIAERIGLPPDPEHTSSLYGIHHTATVRYPDAQISSFYIGPLKIQKRTIHTGFTSPPQAKADGIIGRDILSLLSMDIDYPDRQITLWGQAGCPDSFPTPIPWSFPYMRLHSPPVETTPTTQGFTIPARINNTPLRAIIDTGATISVISDNTLSKSAQKSLPTSGPETYGPDGKLIPTSHTRLNDLSINMEPQPNIPVLVYPGNLPSHIDIIVGITPWLEKHRIWLDPLTQTYAIPEPE